MDGGSRLHCKGLRASLGKFAVVSWGACAGSGQLIRAGRAVLLLAVPLAALQPHLVLGHVGSLFLLHAGQFT